MAILNHITLEALVRLPVSEIISLPAEELARLQQEADLALRKARATVAWLDGALIARYGARAAGARAEDGKDFGIVRFNDGDVTVVAELPKRVDWDPLREQASHRGCDARCRDQPPRRRG
jgi:hypothetical protein